MSYSAIGCSLYFIYEGYRLYLITTSQNLYGSKGLIQGLEAKKISDTVVCKTIYCEIDKERIHEMKSDSKISKNLFSFFRWTPIVDVRRARPKRKR